MAEQFLADDESADLIEFAELDDEAAESLSKHEGWLQLGGPQDNFAGLRSQPPPEKIK